MQHAAFIFFFKSKDFCLKKFLDFLTAHFLFLHFLCFSVPYRDSVLTKLLKNALGGNSKTIMVRGDNSWFPYYISLVFLCFCLQIISKWEHLFKFAILKSRIVQEMMMCWFWTGKPDKKVMHDIFILIEMQDSKSVLLDTLIINWNGIRIWYFFLFF